MINISELFLIQTNDKNPYTLNPDSIFAKLVPSLSENKTISELTINDYSWYFNECKKFNFSYEIKQDRENKLPYESNSNLYDYNFIGIIGNDTNIFTSGVRFDYSIIGSNNYQIIFKDNSANWFICYAQFTSDNIIIENDILVALSFSSDDAKEELYKITTFNLLPEARQEINVDHTGSPILDSSGGYTINVN